MEKLFTPFLIHKNRINTNRKVKLFKKVTTTGILSFLFALVSTDLMAQPTIEWDKMVRSLEPNIFAVVKQTADGGYILGGSSNSEAGWDKSEGTVGGTGLSDYWVVKLDPTGNIEWENTLGGNDGDILTSVSQTADGGYIVAGRAGGNASGDKSENSIGVDTWIVKLNAAGVKEWDKTFAKEATNIEQTPDDGYILWGEGNVIKINALRSIEWERTISGALQQTADEGFILIGPGLAVKLNAAGVTQWEQPLAGGGIGSQRTADGGYIMGGGSEDYHILKLNAAGTKEWEKILGGNTTDIFKIVRQTADGGYIVGGESYSGAGGDKSEANKTPCTSSFCPYSDFWIIKLDAAGNREWDKTVGMTGNDKFSYLEQTADGGYILGGLLDQSQYWVVKLAGEITSPPTGLCNLALTSKVTQAEPWYGMWPGGDGAIDLTVIGGTPPYRYTWNNFRNSPEDAPAVPPGLYTVVVTDAKGCTARGTIEVGKKNDPMRLHTSHTNVTTAGDPVGSIDLSVVGGVVPFKYRWSNGATTEDLTGLPVGTYTVIVTDAFGRTASTAITITNPRTPVLVCNLALTTKVSQAEPWYGMWGPLNGAGAIDLTVNNGTAPYTYHWNNGLSTQDIPTASPGMYSVMVTDANGCTATTTLYVGRKNNPLTLSTSHLNISGAGKADGSVDLSVIGGVVPATYRWSNGATTEDLTGVAAGQYTVTVTDAFGRTATTSVTISAPGTALALTEAHKDVSKAGADDGFIDLTVIGGVGPYTYRWNNGAGTQDLTRVVAGLYTVTVTDATGATASLSVRVMAPGIVSIAKKTGINELFVAKEPGLVVYPNPAATHITVNFSLEAPGTYTLDLYDIRGAKVKNLAIGSTDSEKAVAVEVNLAGYTKGVYLLKLVSAKGTAVKRLVLER